MIQVKAAAVSENPADDQPIEVDDEASSSSQQPDQKRGKLQHQQSLDSFFPVEKDTVNSVIAELHLNKDDAGSIRENLSGSPPHQTNFN